jgi:hypothetical protein
MDNARLGSVVGSLQLREVDNMPAHGSGSDEAAVCKVLELVSVEIHALLLLLAPIVSCIFGTVVCAIEINVNDVGIVC